MFWEKEPKKLKNITILHLMTTFHKVTFKTGQATKVFKPIMKTRNVNNKC